MTSRWLACLLFLTSNALAAPAIVASFTDPAGDDNGAGNLLYPMNRDYQEGDLDLRTFRLLRDEDGFWFEASFANPIRDPATAMMGASAESVADFVRKGFYTFNIDVYVDTDRRRGSGNTFTLPGRHLRIDPGYAWEKAVILTPRPELMRAELMDALQRQYPEHSVTDLDANIDQAIHLPTRIKVRGKTVAFFVPQDFFAMSDGSDWAMTVLVTGAKHYASVGGGLLSSRKTPLEELDMGVLQTSPGRSPTMFGSSGRGVASPVVDLLLPAAEGQAELLANQVPLTGVSWGKHAAKDSPLRVRSQTSPPITKDQRDSAPSGPSGFLKGLIGDSGAKPRPRSSAPGSVGALLDPPASQSSPTGAVAPATSPADIPARLQTLRKLLDDGLITETEFNQHKQRILGDL
jgi:hypothetical protein